MRTFKKRLAWPGVFALFALLFAAASYVTSQPLALAIERATWHFGLVSRYHAAPTYFVAGCSWIAVMLTVVATVRWLGKRAVRAAPAG